MANDSVLVIEGFDFTPYTIWGEGFKWTRNDLDSEETKPLSNGVQRRDRMIIRPSIDVVLDPTLEVDDSMIFNMLKALEPQWLTVTYFDPRRGQSFTHEYYTGGIEVYLIGIKNGKRMWKLKDFRLQAKGVPNDGRAK